MNTIAAACTSTGFAISAWHGRRLANRAFNRAQRFVGQRAVEEREKCGEVWHMKRISSGLGTVSAVGQLVYSCASKKPPAYEFEDGEKRVDELLGVHRRRAARLGCPHVRVLEGLHHEKQHA